MLPDTHLAPMKNCVAQIRARLSEPILAQRCEILLAYCLSDIDGNKDLQKLKGLPLVRMADDSIATIQSGEGDSEFKMMYVMGSREAATLSVLSHKIIKWNVSSLMQYVCWEPTSSNSHSIVLLPY